MFAKCWREESRKNVGSFFEMKILLAHPEVPETIFDIVRLTSRLDGRYR